MPTAQTTICEAAQTERLRRILPHWLRQVPLYREAAARLSLDSPEAFDLAHFRALPFITKREIRRDFPRNFLAEGVELDALIELDLVEIERTSGTSEASTSLLLGKGWWAQQEERALRLNRRVKQVLDEFPQARRVTLNSPVCSGEICYKGVPTRAERALGDTLFVNLSRHPFLWSEADLARMAAETLEWRPQFLDLDPVYGMLFARYCERENIRLPSLQFLLCSYEYVSVIHRRVLERVFGVPVFDLYGSTETGHLLMETDAGAMRPSLDTAFLEVIEPDSDGVGELVVTTLTNEYMPLLRYRIGDLVSQHPAADGCEYRVHGRASYALAAGARGRVTVRQVDACFEGAAGIAHYQLIQERGGEWRLRYAPDNTPPSPAALAEVRDRLADALGPVSQIHLEETPILLAESSGKFRLAYGLADDPA